MRCLVPVASGVQVEGGLIGLGLGKLWKGLAFVVLAGVFLGCGGEVAGGGDAFGGFDGVDDLGVLDLGFDVVAAFFRLLACGEAFGLGEAGDRLRDGHAEGRHLWRYRRVGAWGFT